ncbi:thioredoxin [Candidatus Shapirobacteria bacterium]|nr:thioredoxin [Candidatus Shapirobacteria bacterium]
MGVLTLNDKNFKKEVLEDKGVVVVDFWAPWCGPCQIMGPISEEFASKMEGRVKVGKLNIDEGGLVAGKYKVMSIPTLIIFKNGEAKKQLVGVQPKDILAKEVKPFLVKNE